MELVGYLIITAKKKKQQILFYLQMINGASRWCYNCDTKTEQETYISYELRFAINYCDYLPCLNLYPHPRWKAL